MNRKWDHSVPSVELWKEILRVTKHGGYILVACGTRTQHRMAVNIEDAGFEIRDVITWHYGSGFPKSLNVSKAIDSKMGAEREQIENPLAKQQTGQIAGKGLVGNKNALDFIEPNPVTDEAKQWDGWGTALKPATEFWTLARKPLAESTVAENFLKHGTGGINIDGCRIETDEEISNHSRGSDSAISKGKYGDSKEQETHQTEGQQKGRFPSNVIFDDFTGDILDAQTGNLTSGAMTKSYEYQNNGFSLGKPTGSTKSIHESNEGGGSRFFYCAKASKAERNFGLKSNGINENKHPTIKPIMLMSWFVRLVTPPDGIVLDPFNGSGSTGVACKVEKFDYLGIDREREYVDISEARIKSYQKEKEEYERRESKTPEIEDKSQLSFF